MGIYAEAVQKLYVAYFNRPADALGLIYWEEQVAKNGGSVAAVANAFSASQEYKDLYAGKDSANVVNSIYLNLFGRPAEVDGLLYWGSRLENKTFDVGTIAMAILTGAQNDDKKVIDNKTAAAVEFTKALDTTAEITAYSGNAANAVAKAWLGAITASADSLTAAKASVNSTITSIGSGTVANGQTFTLTTGVDTLTGTANNDTFIAATGGNFFGQATLNTSDVIDGGDGVDTLKVYADGVTQAQQGTIKNIEKVLIDNAQGFVFRETATGNLNAGKFEGATEVTQIGAAASVSNLAATTTAGFKGVTAGAGLGLSVTGAASANSVSIALDGLKGDAATAAANPGSAGTPGNAGPDTIPGTIDDVAPVPAVPASPATIQNQAVLNVAGDAVSKVTVSGTLKQTTTTTGAAAASLALNVVAGVDATNKSVSTVTVKTDVKTTLTINEKAGSTGSVKDVQAYDSLGGITFTGDAQTATILTGAGDDVLTVTTATAKTGVVVNADIGTGAGKDTINVRTTGDGKVAVSSGHGDDTIVLAAVVGGANVVAAGTLAITAGEGNDKVVLSAGTANRAVTTNDVIDGGDGSDTVVLAGSTTARTADDFIVFNKVLKNFETLTFTSAEGVAGATGAFDASKLAANYTGIDFATDSFVTKVTTQALTANGNLTARADGMILVGEVPAAGGAAATTTTYAGTLNVTEKATGTVTAIADVVNLAVKAGTADVTATLAGNVQTANVTLTNAVNSLTAPTADTIASVSVTANAGTNLGAMTALTLSGNGSASVTNTAGKLATVDASALGGVASYDEVIGGVTYAKGGALKGLTYASSNVNAETVKLGAGLDAVTLNASTYGKADSIVGLNLVLNATGTALDAAKSDDINVAGNGSNVYVKMTTTHADLDLALKDAAALSINSVAKENVVFQLGGDTYIYVDTNASNLVDANDTVVKLVGTIDLDALIIALA
ncbi:DUF4214 domain-containing protein [Noviherbaspirillum malthae]|uniref:DUF4214 domain-containing protein n=1 Tax=Noviherbaspirillum malthae TaxID=1260987 RepID=UPI00188E0E4D|nr:DUF4214 domain-containing protein [Noviherbaspirillum malthae]